MTDAPGPGLTAMSDQFTAHVQRELAGLAQAVADSDALYGEGQTTASFITYLAGRHPPAALAGMIVIALRRLRDADRDDQPR